MSYYRQSNIDKFEWVDFGELGGGARYVEPGSSEGEG
jgi:hypothetical protein